MISALSIAIQGTRGSYHAIAARNYGLRNDMLDFSLLECKNFPDVIVAVCSQRAQIGLMAIENSLGGSLLPNHERIRKSGLAVIGEEILRISHCLAALPGTQIDQLVEVASHPMALLQCEKFLIDHFSGRPDPLRIVEKNDTATSARWIADNQQARHAAICSREAADAYGLEILAEAIETNAQNYTRFLVLSQKGREKTDEIRSAPQKSLLVFSLPHQVGSLSQVLAVLSFYGMNLTKIQSFPMPGEAWQYLFYIDLAFEDVARYRQALDAVIPLTRDLKVLGEY